MEFKNKIKSKIVKKPVSEKKVSPVTNRTLETERKEVLKNAQKFKYPVQYSKHKLVINTLIISFILGLAGLAFVTLRLYAAQDTGTFIYRISKFLPFYSVAQIDGENVRYSDYLMEYRANMTLTDTKKGALEVDSDFKSRSNRFKKSAMDNSLKNALALKIARENNIKVSDQEIAERIAEQRKSSTREISEKDFYASIAANYGLSPQEYRRMFVELPLYRSKVSAFLDKDAEALKNQVTEFLSKNENSFEKLAANFVNKIEVGKSGNVRHSNIDGGRTRTALDLKVGETSKPFISKSGDGYYVVKLISKTDTEVSYEYAKIPFSAFENKFTALKNDGKIQEFIKIEGR
ncbi:MAG: peptidylprolyl isomerase [bacterium]|nr:peptidylprolyl isomerase [bacterium]